MTSFAPYGRLTNGNLGINVDPTSGQPLVTAMEILPSLPATSSSDNYTGRMVYDTSTGYAYIFQNIPSAGWSRLNLASSVTIQATNAAPSSTPTPATGALVYDTLSAKLWLWTGASWVAIAGQFASRIVTNVLTGDGATTTFSTGASSVTSVDYVFVDIDGVEQKSGVDFTLSGTNIIFGIAPPNASKVQIKTFEDANAINRPLFENRASFTGASYVATSTDSYIGAAGTATIPQSVDISAITAIGAPNSGRKIIIKDEGGNASTNNITITTGANVDGASSKVINTNYGSTTMVFDGTNWFTV